MRWVLAWTLSAAVLLGMLIGAALAQTDGVFSLTPQPCDRTAITSGGWCMDALAALPSTDPAIPPPPIIIGPFATILTPKVQLTGTGIAGDIIAIAIDGNRDPGLVTVQKSGLWVFNANAMLTNGTHIATAIQTNAIGPSAMSAPFTFAVSVP